MDQVQKESLPEEMNEIKKFCCDCKTTKTPLWRAGPSGPKSLCNACGIRYRKKRSAVVGLNKSVEKEEKSATTSLTNTNTTAATTVAAAKNRCGGGGGKGCNLSEDLRVRLVALGKEVVMLQRQRSPMRKRQRRRRSVKRKLGEEEEQAAFLLMSLSCGFVFA
ncbi:GATA transcription factor 16-like isoform X1 [Rhododendron vialii]|uniref:GATA transcription factor 16-like isoform X1 n=1 Tax=Rhododendron vialii TaxID=182163 RepID=UPI00265F50FF|nr:GATA transcription factor 16-like isoform X1 [Rhododendron vialii]